MKTKLLAIIAALACVHVRPDSQDEVNFKLACADLQDLADTIEGEIQETVNDAVEKVADAVTESRESEFKEALVDAAALSEKVTAERAASMDVFRIAIGERLDSIEAKNEALEKGILGVSNGFAEMIAKLDGIANAQAAAAIAPA